MSYLEVFGLSTGLGVDVSKFFGVGTGVVKRGAGPESESEKCDSTHFCCQRFVDGAVNLIRARTIFVFTFYLVQKLSFQ